MYFLTYKFSNIKTSAAQKLLLKLIANWWAWELVPSRVGGGPAQIPGTAGRFNGNPVSGNQPCKRPPTGTVTLKELQWRNLPDPIPTMNHFLNRDGKGWAQNCQNRRPKQWSTSLNWGSDPQRSAQETTAILATRAQMQAHGEASPCGHPTDMGDRWDYWLELNLA